MYFRIRTTMVFVLYLFQQTNTCSTSATKITEDNPKENIYGEVVAIHDVNLSL